MCDVRTQKIDPSQEICLQTKLKLEFAINFKLRRLRPYATHALLLDL